ncbi:cupin-like domain-containing protein [Chitinophaga nivalis]|uniref:Cupin-like domain-containing protein n=1 Tax=Chitinophaga nivalis TaxID=2991709 RepID=A0ABT3IHP5_9BACT|nr:cupin-like domain-containing protein [Chitinophaga nivalis]MCW3466821.1 cupin-like domain-containing protein [Chitinophaga nivalis]MCW3483488.1 cupin-like domain-containing protein [Chitinophaga nivalis]
MIVKHIDRVDNITPAEFKENYYKPRKPVVITAGGLSKNWQAHDKWTWDYFKSVVGDKMVGVYNNERAGANTLVNGADDYIAFGDYLDMIQRGPVKLRIFLFNIFQHVPQLVEDFTWPDILASGFLKKYPMLFVGGAGSIAHMHYDIDLSHIFHTQFLGRKRVLLLENKQSPYIYRMPFTVESAASFVNWHEELDTEQFPALKYAQGHTTILHHGDTLFMPGGYWHHMEYMDGGFAMSLRALDPTLTGKLNGLYHLVGLRGMNNLMIKMAPEWWYHYKRKKARDRAEKLLKSVQ